jgi:hypothetical protein
MVGSIPQGMDGMDPTPQLPTSPEASVPSEVHLKWVQRQATIDPHNCDKTRSILH